MTPTDTGNAYNQITHLWEREAFDRTNAIAVHQRAIRLVTHKKLALDIGCGCTGRLIELMIQSGFTPQGIDISEKMLQLAKLKHPQISFFHDDICQWQPPCQYDFISAWDSIWHVPLAQQEALIIKLMSMLNAGGVLIFSAGGLENPQEHTDDAMGVTVYYSTLGFKKYLALIQNNNGTCHYMHNEIHSYFIIEKH